MEEEVSGIQETAFSSLDRDANFEEGERGSIAIEMWNKIFIFEKRKGTWV